MIDFLMKTHLRTSNHFVLSTREKRVRYVARHSYCAIEFCVEVDATVRAPSHSATARVIVNVIVFVLHDLSWKHHKHFGAGYILFTFLEFF